MGNRYTEKSNKEQGTASNEELLLQIMQQEFPNDPMFKNGELSQAKATKLPNGKGKKKADILKNDTDRNEQGVVDIYAVYQHTMPDGTMMAGKEHEGSEPGTEKIIPQYTKYNLDKSFPTVDEDELDEIIDEEWEYFEDPDEE